MTWASEAKRYREEELQLYDSMPAVTRCAFCGQSHSGTALTGRVWASKHRLRKHPEAKQKLKTSRGLKSFRQPTLSEEESSDIERERRKRARLIGISLD